MKLCGLCPVLVSELDVGRTLLSCRLSSVLHLGHDCILKQMLLLVVQVRLLLTSCRTSLITLGMRFAV